MKNLATLFTIVLLSLTSFGQPHPVISQVYGGGGNAGAAYANDFVELFNSGTDTVDLSSWSVHYASATSSSWSITPLNGALPPHHYYLIQEASGGSNGMVLPAPDAVGTINLSATAGKIALCHYAQPDTTLCIFADYYDMVGYGSTANCYEGSGYAPAPSSTKSIFRKNGGCTDTDSNDVDFSTATPNPRNSVTPANNCALNAIDDIRSTAIISIFPNPAENELWVMNYELWVGGTIEVRNMVGALVLQSTQNTLPTTLNLSTLPKGIYILSVSDGKKSVNSKFIKQ